MTLLLKLIGLIFLAVGGYYLYRVGFYLINYDLTLGIDPAKGGHGRPYWEVLAEFIFWLTLAIGGLGIYRSKGIGLRFGLFSVVTATVVILLHLIVAISSKSKYSKILIVNKEERVMTAMDQWNYIYKEPVSLAVLTVVAFLVIVLLWRQIKTERPATLLRDDDSLRSPY